MPGPGFLKANPKIFWKALNTFYSAFKALTSNLYSLQEEELRNSKDFFFPEINKICYYFIFSMYIICSPMKKYKLQTLKMYLFNLHLYVDSILNFQKYLENNCGMSQYKIWTKQNLVTDNKNDTLCCISHETEAILNYCTIYKLTSISIQPLCPVCLLVMSKKRSTQSKAWSNMANPINSQSVSMPWLWFDPAEESKAFSHVPASYDLPSSGSKRTQISSQLL